MANAPQTTPRRATVARKTAETDINLALSLDGTGESQVSTGIGFFNHMLTLLARHALFDLTVTARGDLAVDGHHTVEDVGICLGLAIKDALGDKAGLARYGSILLPMEEALVRLALDLSGRAYLAWRAPMPAERVGLFDTCLGREFTRALCANAGMNLHVDLLAGEDPHHCLEALFKGLGRVLRQAVARDPRETGVPSTKGAL